MLQIPPILKTHVQTKLFQTHIRRLCLGLCNVNIKHKINTYIQFPCANIQDAVWPVYNVKCLCSRGWD